MRNWGRYCEMDRRFRLSILACLKRSYRAQTAAPRVRRLLARNPSLDTDVPHTGLRPPQRAAGWRRVVRPHVEIPCALRQIALAVASPPPTA
jgi:hypothetical protein